MSNDPRNGPVRKIVVPGAKDDSGTFLPEKVDLDIDSLLNEGLSSVWGILRVVRIAVKSGAPSRNDVMNLKDCMAMLHELKKQEIDLLDELTEDELEELLAKRARK